MTILFPNMCNYSKNIVYLLSLNSRISTSELAKKLRISRKMTENRVRILYDNGLIKPLLIYNHKNLLKATILIKLSRFDKDVMKSIKKISRNTL